MLKYMRGKERCSFTFLVSFVFITNILYNYIPIYFSKKKREFSSKKLMLCWYCVCRMKNARRRRRRRKKKEIKRRGKKEKKRIVVGGIDVYLLENIFIITGLSSTFVTGFLFSAIIISSLDRSGLILTVPPDSLR